MKKFAFTLALALTCLLSAAQQPHKTLKERMQHGLSIEQIEKSVQNRLNYTQRFDSIVQSVGDEKLVLSYTYDENANLSAKYYNYYNADNFVSLTKYIYAYDQNNNCLSETQYICRNGGCYEITKHEYTYDANGNCLSDVFSYDGSLNKKDLWTYDSENRCVTEECWYYHSTYWGPTTKTTRVYNANGDVVYCLHQVGDEVENWYNTNKEEYEFNNNYDLISQTFYSWNMWTLEWEIQEKKTYSYDVNGNVICEMHYDYYYDSLIKIEYTYDEENRYIFSAVLKWDNSNESWENYSKSEYEYDQNDSIILEAHYSYYDSIWYNEHMSKYSRNDAGYATNVGHAFGYTSDEDQKWFFYDSLLYDYDNCYRLVCTINMKKYGESFVYESKDICEFDDYGNITNLACYAYGNNEWIVKKSYESTYGSDESASILGLHTVYKETFEERLPIEKYPVRSKWLSCNAYENEEMWQLSIYYSDYYDVDENESATLKVYTTEGTLTVENDNIADIQVFDMLGRLVAQQNQVTQCRFNLKPGVYVVKAGNASVKAVVK